MNILVAVELIREVDEEIIGRALDVAQGCDANLHLVHVVDTTGEYGVTSPHMLVDIIEEHEANARKQINELGTAFDIPQENQFVVVGLVREVIADLLKIIDADLLVVGNHGRHGFDALFHWNNTVSLAKHTDCDMLAVRVA